MMAKITKEWHLALIDEQGVIIGTINLKGYDLDRAIAGVDLVSELRELIDEEMEKEAKA